MKLSYFKEFKENDLAPIKSFYIKDTLNPKIWDNFKIDEQVREQLLQIAQDFYESVDLKAEVKDIILCGSLANYNWSEKYSDYDLHIVIDYSDVDENTELVEKVCDLAKKQWMVSHDIYIKGYEVEVYIQNGSQELKSQGVYSLMNDKWLVRPERVEFEPDEKSIKDKATPIMGIIDDLEEEVDEDKYPEFKKKLEFVWNKIKKMRKAGLEKEGEFSIGNLVFKLLRRNGYIEKVMDLKRYSYDRQFN